MTKSIEQQTGWKRSHPNMLLMNSDLLEKINEYSYVMSDIDFVDYAHARGCMNGAFKKGSSLRSYIEDHHLSYKKFLSETFYLENGNVMPQCDKESLWHCVCLGRASLEDCWEVYSGICSSSKKSEAPKQLLLF